MEICISSGPTCFHTPGINLGGGEPGIQRIDRSTGEIDDFVVIRAAGLGAAEMGGERGEGASMLTDNRCFLLQLFVAQTRNLAAPAAT